MQTMQKTEKAKSRKAKTFSRKDYTKKLKKDGAVLQIWANDELKYSDIVHYLGQYITMVEAFGYKSSSENGWHVSTLHSQKGL